MVHWLRENRAGAAGIAGTDEKRHELLRQGIPHYCRKKQTHRNLELHNLDTTRNIIEKIEKKAHTN